MESKYNLGKWFRICLKLLLLGYVITIIRLIVFKHPIPVLRGIMDTWDIDMVRNGIYTANLVPFKTIKMYMEYYHQINGFDNLFGNIFAFVPFGVLVPAVFPKYRKVFNVLLASFVFSLGIELFQLISHFGEFDVDDILLNCFGAVLGYIVFCVIYYFHKINTHQTSIKHK